VEPEAEEVMERVPRGSLEKCPSHFFQNVHFIKWLLLLTVDYLDILKISPHYKTCKCFINYNKHVKSAFKTFINISTLNQHLQVMQLLISIIILPRAGK
jgi:hypothetical protein